MHLYTSFGTNKLYLNSYASQWSKDNISCKRILLKISPLKCNTQLQPISYEQIRKFLLPAKLKLSKRDHYPLNFHRSIDYSKQIRQQPKNHQFYSEDSQTFCTLGLIFHANLQKLKKCTEKLCYKLQKLIQFGICLLICLLIR